MKKYSLLIWIKSHLGAHVQASKDGEEVQVSDIPSVKTVHTLSGDKAEVDRSHWTMSYRLEERFFPQMFNSPSITKEESQNLIETSVIEKYFDQDGNVLEVTTTCEFVM